ncbi:TonB-dependent siderophore receptor [Herbaspirillum rubrisubalbicans]|uniref:TonB-dependent siderophore receptor n=2 Tax=Herbaspirillum rubrisubalbicans TaxID=80842 RepID=A0AAD0XGI0_9BURK|nr:TonB-dependent siderophore receptor [Herbaspirillum rubrisubalbicans]
MTEKRYFVFKMKTCAGVIAVLCAQHAYAADNSEDTTASGNLPSVVVTGDKVPTPDALPAPFSGGQVATGGRLGFLGNRDVLDAPFNTVSYTAQLIEDQQAKSVSDVLANNPSVRIYYPDNDGSTDFFVRGNKVSQLDIAYDGLYGIGTPGIESLERIDVLIGANALLNGLGPSGGVGAMINQVPKKALETPLTRLTFGWISDSQFGGAIDFSRRLGEDGQFGIRVNAAYRDGDTAVNNQSRTVGTATVAMDWRGRGVRVSTNVGYRKNDNQSPSRTTYMLTSTFQIPSPPSDPKQNWQNSWTYDNTETKFATARAEVDITPDVTAYAAIGGSQFKEEQLFANTFLTSSTGALLRRTVYWPLYRNTWTAETGLRGTTNTGPVKHKWSLTASTLSVTNGIALNDLGITASNIYTPVYFGQPSIAGLRDSNSVHKTGATDLSGIALSDTLSILNDKLQWTIGVREQNVATKTYTEATGAMTGRYDKSKLTYATGLTVRPINNLSLYANYIEGLQAGVEVPSGYTNAGQVFAPYVSKQYEIGAKYDFGGFLTTLNAYQLTTPNAQANGTLYTVDGEQRTKGVELNTYGSLTRDVRLLGGVAFTDARQTNTVNGTNNGKKVQAAADVQANLGLEWDFAPGFTVSGRTIYTGREYIDTANLQSIPSSVRYDAGLRYMTTLAGHPTAFRFNVENLTNKSYWLGGNGFVMQSRPRTFTLSASVDL